MDEQLISSFHIESSMSRTEIIPPRISKFTPKEDELLKSLVERLGTTDWSVIARQMRGRNTRQCRERWQNYLRPGIRNGPWTQQEEELLLVKYVEYGPLWRTIATFLPPRTDIDIKNYWNRRLRRLRNTQGVQSAHWDDQLGSSALDPSEPLDAWSWEPFTE
jgi:hypothetical protein